MCDNKNGKHCYNDNTSSEIFHSEKSYKRHVDFSIEPSKDKDFDIYFMTVNNENESDGDKK